jgi:hypothetical protein
MVSAPMFRGLSIAFLLLSAETAAAASAARVPPAAKAAPARGPSFPLSRATPEEVTAWLGEPTVASDEGKGAFWTYRLEDCALRVFFKDEGGGLKVSGVATGPRRRADTAPDAEACIANAKRN